MRMIFFAAIFAASLARSFEPTSAYLPREIDGFTVLVHRDVLTHSNEFNDAQIELKKQLDFMTNALPQKPLAALRGVRIWLEWESKKNGGAEFHPSREWLVAHDYNPEKTRNVEINNTRHFIDWSRRTQPCMVIHEFSHAYHFIVLGHDYAPVAAGYKRAKESGIYDSVEFILGGKKRHYALTDDKEFFAELSESYFGKNDFFPFTRDELKKYDPESYAVIDAAWQSPVETKGR
jgi:hypothetical protein